MRLTLGALLMSFLSLLPSAQTLFAGAQGSTESGYPVVKINKYGLGVGIHTQCIGTLISPRIVLTAAHCLMEWNEKGLRDGETPASPEVQVVHNDSIHWAIYAAVPTKARVLSKMLPEEDVALLLLDYPVTEESGGGDVSYPLLSDRKDSSTLIGKDLYVVTQKTDLDREEPNPKNSPQYGGWIQVQDQHVNRTNLFESPLFSAFSKPAISHGGNHTEMNFCPGDSGSPAFRKRTRVSDPLIIEGVISHLDFLEFPFNLLSLGRRCPLYSKVHFSSVALHLKWIQSAIKRLYEAEPDPIHPSFFPAWKLKFIN